MAKNELDKRVLAKIPLQLATKSFVSQAKRNEEIYYYIKAKTQIIDHKRMLVFYAYHRKDLILGNLNPCYRTFMTHTSQNGEKAG